MSPLRESDDLKAYGRQLGELLAIGGAHLKALAKAKKQITFENWSEMVRRVVPQPSLKDEQLEWLWHALTTEPAIRRKLRTQIVSREEEWKNKPTVTVLDSSHFLGIFLKRLSGFGVPVLSVPSNPQPDGMIKLLAPLKMGPGKAGRFECRDVKATVEIRVEKVGSLDEEAVRVKLDRVDVAVQRQTVMAWVRSLNHAFTVTSRRLEPHRRNHGGRIYDHIAWRKSDKWIPLEEIRRAVEADQWKGQ